MAGPVAGRRGRPFSLANWMIDGDPGGDIWGMDVARYGDYATLAYTNAKVRENYSRRFRITFPNEELTAARPLHTTPVYDRFCEHNAVWGASFGLEHPLWFQEPGLEPFEDVTFRRSNAWDRVAAESRAVRERVGLSECSNFAKYRVTGPDAAAWLQGLFTNKLPKVGRTVLTAMLNPQGRIVGEFSVSRLADDVFYLFGSQPAEVHHSRWFLAHLPDDAERTGSVRFEILGLSLVGSHDRRAARPRRAATADRSVARDQGLRVHELPPRRHRDDPGDPQPDDLHRRPRLRDLGRPRVPAPAVRSAVGGRPAVRDGAVRVPRAHHDAPREALRHLVPRVPPDLHPARSRDGSVPEARPRFHRARRRSKPRSRRAVRSASSSCSRSTRCPRNPPT